MYVKSQWKFKNLNYWSRKFHIHLALFLLLFIWLFSFSGLLLNHGKWKFASFWDERKEKITKSSIHDTNNLDSAAMLKKIMQQLKGSFTGLFIISEKINPTKADQSND